jgi:hypothetical protein
MEFQKNITNKSREFRKIQKFIVYKFQQLFTPWQMDASGEIVLKFLKNGVDHVAIKVIKFSHR